MKVQKIGTCVATCEGALGSLEGKDLGEFGREGVFRFFVLGS